MEKYGLTRKALLTGALAAGVAGCATSSASADGSVETSSGRVRGSRTNGVTSFWGVPFGADTGPRRFQTALPAPAWTGVRECTSPGAQAPQGLMAAAALTPLPPGTPGAQVQAIFTAGLSRSPQSEDCLFLNVFTPDASNARKRPVMVWLHGGGFAMGTGGVSVYDGSNLARRGDVVVVSINHRLSAMGYLYLGALHDDFADSGNVGMLDIVLALEWVRDNIEAFGGDPGNVTIFGESGGGAKVGVLLAMPPAQGLFHKGIVQSGPVLRMIERDEAASLAERALAALNLAPAEVHRLKSLPFADVIRAASGAERPSRTLGGGRGVTLSPCVDGGSLPRHPFEPDATPLARNVPVIIGTNKDEATLFMAAMPGFGAMTEEQARAQYNAAFGERGGAAYDAFRRARPNDSPTHMATTLATGQGMWINSIRQAERKAAQAAAQVYMYRVDWESPAIGGLLKAYHGVEVPMVFDSVAEMPSEALGDASQRPVALGHLVSQAWVNFAHTGDPSQAGLAWPRYDAQTRQTMIFNTETSLVRDPDRELRELLASI